MSDETAGEGGGRRVSLSGRRIRRGQSDEELLEEFFRTRSPELRDQLILHNERLANYLAARYAGKGEPLEDLRQVARIGLINAIDRFKPGLGLKFGTYVTPTIIGELKRHFRDKVPVGPKMSRDLTTGIYHLERAEQTLSNALGRAPTVEDLAKAMGKSSEEVMAIRRASHAQQGMCDLDGPVGESSGSLAEVIPDHSDAYAAIINRMGLQDAVISLTAEQQRIIHLKFDEELNQGEIGRMLDPPLSQAEVSRRQIEAIGRLRRYFMTQNEIISGNHSGEDVGNAHGRSGTWVELAVERDSVGAGKGK